MRMIFEANCTGKDDLFQWLNKTIPVEDHSVMGIRRSSMKELNIPKVKCSLYAGKIPQFFHRQLAPTIFDDRDGSCSRLFRYTNILGLQKRQPSRQTMRGSYPALEESPERVLMVIGYNLPSYRVWFAYYTLLAAYSCAGQIHFEFLRFLEGLLVVAAQSRI